jgi:hypothetical protein
MIKLIERSIAAVAVQAFFGTAGAIQATYSPAAMSAGTDAGFARA